MIKTIFGIMTVLTVLATPAAAVTFECVHGKQTFAQRKEKQDSRREKDPVYKIVIQAWTEDLHAHMAIEHVTISGNHYDRAEQYPINSLTQRQGNYYWSGDYVKDPRVVMTGALVFNNGHWTYTETRYDKGQFAWRNRTTCIEQDSD